MKSITIKGSKRESVGKSATKALRNAGGVPCVLYGGRKETLHFSAPEVSFNKLVYTADVHRVVLEIGDIKANAILQDIQFHPVTDAILHMDFYQFNDESPITMTLPVHTTGVAAGVKVGGVLQTNMRRMDIRGLIGNMPDYIEVNVADLKIGEKIYVSDVMNDKFEILHEEDGAICQVIAPRDLETIEPELEEEEVPSEQGDNSEEADKE